MDIILLIIISFAGSLGTFYCSKRFGWNPVRSSAGLSFIVALFLKIFPTLLSSYLTETVPVVFIGSTFVGMVSVKQTSSYFGIAFAAGIYSVIFLYSSQYFEGYGGALGTTACVSLLVILSSPYFKSDKKLRVGMRKVKYRFKRTEPR